MSKYLVTFTESVTVEADDDREAEAVAEEYILVGLGPRTEGVTVERVSE